MCIDLSDYKDLLSSGTSSCPLHKLYVVTKFHPLNLNLNLLVTDSLEIVSKREAKRKPGKHCMCMCNISTLTMRWLNIFETIICWYRCST